MRRDRAGRPLARRRQPDERRAGEARAVIAIRAARPEDAAAIAAIYAPHVTSGTASFEIEAPDSRAMRSRMASSDGLYPWMVVTNGDDEQSGIVACAYATRFRDQPAYSYVVETSIYLARPVPGHGTGRFLHCPVICTL